MLNPPVSDDAVGPYICLHIVTLSYVSLRPPRVVTREEIAIVAFLQLVDC